MDLRSQDRINRFIYAWGRTDFIPLRETDMWELEDSKGKKIFTNKTQMHKILSSLKQQGLIINRRVSHKRSIYMLAVDEKVQRECLELRSDYKKQIDDIIKNLKSYESIGVSKEDLFRWYVAGILRVSEMAIKILEITGRMPARFNLFKQYFIIEMTNTSNKLLANMWNLKPDMMKEALNAFHKIVDKQHILITKT